MEDNEELEETEEQDEEKMKTSDEVEDDSCDDGFNVLHHPHQDKTVQTSVTFLSIPHRAQLDKK